VCCACINVGTTNRTNPWYYLAQTGDFPSFEGALPTAISIPALEPVGGAVMRIGILGALLMLKEKVSQYRDTLKPTERDKGAKALIEKYDYTN
jgi:hypothetical protein